MLEDDRQEIWEAHKAQWRHCLRCSLADIRLKQDKKAGKYPTRVPMAAGRGATEDRPPKSGAPLFVLYSCPDGQQETAEHVFGYQSSDGGTNSPSHGLVQWSWDALGQLMPFPIDEVVFGFALGCRPVSYKDPRSLVKAKGEFIKGCRRRWQIEVLLADPDLLLLCGRHALAAVRPDLATKHSKLIGEVVTLTIPTGDGTATYEAFVTTSPEEVVASAREDQYEVHDWNIAPEQSHVDDPIRHWLWFLLYASWLAQTLRDVEEGKQPSDVWVSLLGALSKFYDTRTTVTSLLERKSGLFRRMEQVAADELSGAGVRHYQPTDLQDEDDDDEDE